MSEDQLYDAAEREMDLYRREITRLTADGDRLRLRVADVTAALAVTEAERNDLRQALDERNRQLEGLTRVVIDVTDRPVLAGLAAALRTDAGMTVIDQFSRPAAPTAAPQTTQEGHGGPSARPSQPEGSK